MNRLAWLRTSHNFLSAIVINPCTRWIIFKAGQPLLVSQNASQNRSLAQLSTSDVRLLLGPEPFFSQGQHDGEVAADEVKELQAARLHGPGIVFLGLHETDPEAAEALPSSDFSAKGNAAEVAAKVKGTPYFSLDVSGVEEKQVDEVLQKSEAGKNGATFAFVDGRQAMSSMDYVVGAIYAEARAMVDWNARNKVRIFFLHVPFNHPNFKYSIALLVVPQCFLYGPGGS